MQGISIKFEENTKLFKTKKTLIEINQFILFLLLIVKKVSSVSITYTDVLNYVKGKTLDVLRFT